MLNKYKKGVITRSMSEVQVEIYAVILKEEEYFVVYCPALELSSYAKTEEQARKRFEEEVQIFFEETSQRGTLEKLLLQLGWTLRKKPEPYYQPPANTISNNIGTSFTERIAIPV